MIDALAELAGPSQSAPDRPLVCTLGRTCSGTISGYGLVATSKVAVVSGTCTGGWSEDLCCQDDEQVAIFGIVDASSDDGSTASSYVFSIFYSNFCLNLNFGKF